MSSTKQLHFFVVDDDKTICALVEKLLEARGHKVTATTDSTTALEQIERLMPDCVIGDLMMPKVDGYELLRRVKAEPKLAGVRFVVLSAKAYPFDQHRAFDFGADGFIGKPINPETFYDRLERVMSDHVDLVFWGVRGTLPVAGGKAIRYGGNTSCVTLEFPRGQLFVFDGGSGIKALGDHLMRQKRTRISAKIFISHPHWDHINALPFFSPLYTQGNEFEFLGANQGDISMRQMISAQMDGVFFPITLTEFAARVYFRDLEEETFEVDGLTVRSKLLSHPGKCLGYRVEYNGRAICYVTDNEMYLDDHPHHDAHYEARLAEFVEGADALITDTTYTDDEYKTKVGWGHSCVSKVVELADRAKVKTLYLFHHDPDQSDRDIDEKLATAQHLLSERKSTTQVLAPEEGQLFRI